LQALDSAVDRRVEIRRSFDHSNVTRAEEPHGDPALRVYTSANCVDLGDADRYATDRRAEAAKREPDSSPDVCLQRTMRIDVAYPYFELHATSIDRQSVTSLYGLLDASTSRKSHRADERKRKYLVIRGVA
jgi:hypothetical protein